MRELHLTASIVEVTLDHREGTVFADVMLEVLTHRACLTLIWAGHWVNGTNWPVFARNVFEASLIDATVFTAEGSFNTLRDLMFVNVSTLKKSVTLNALNFSKRTPTKLFIHSRLLIQVLVKLPQATCPLAAFLLMGAVNAIYGERTLESLVWENTEISFFTGWTGTLLELHSLDTHLTEGVPTAGHLMGLTKH